MANVPLKVQFFGIMITFEKAIQLLTQDFDETVQTLACVNTTSVNIRRSESMAFVELKDEGVSIAAKLDNWRPHYGLAEKAHSNGFFVTGIHFHSAANNGYRVYVGGLWNGIFFGQKIEDVIVMCGVPAVSGGGVQSKVVSGHVPRWIKYALGENKFVHLQFSDHDGLELLTLMLERPRRGASRKGAG